MGQYEKHVFICTSGTTCPIDGDAVGVQKTLKKLVAERPELKGRIRINQAGCMNQCGHGPMVVVYPDDVRYWKMTPEKAREVVEQHLAAGRPVEKYRYYNKPGDNKLPRDDQNRVLDDPCHPREDSAGRPENAASPASPLPRGEGVGGGGQADQGGAT